MPVYENIAKDISTDVGQCVLLLGPELCVNSKGIYYKSNFKKLFAEKSSCIKQYFEKENIFSFVDEFGFGATEEEIRGFYEDVGDKTLLELIARIKFPLVVNVCPDKALNRVYQENHIPHRYDYLCKIRNYKTVGRKYSYTVDPAAHGVKTEQIETLQEIEAPSKSNPLIYNIFGDYEVVDTMIFDHQGFYEAVEKLMAEDAIPGAITNFIKTANSFIFLGFDFDSWHYQLVCHKLGLGKGSKKKSYSSPKYLHENHIEKNDENRYLQENLVEKMNVNIIMNNYFKVNFMEENPAHTMQEIIREMGLNDRYKTSLRTMGENRNFSVFISYAWKDKQADILELAAKVFSKNGIPEQEKSTYLRNLLNTSGKQVPDNTDLSWIINTGKNEKGQTLEEWYNELPSVNNQTAEGPKELLYDREFVVKKLEEKLEAKGIKVFRDKNEMTYGDSIDSFMNRIGTGKAVLRVVSDKYLKSRYCMDEALRIHKYANNESRIFTIILKDDTELVFPEKDKTAGIILPDGDNILYQQYWATMVEHIYGRINEAQMHTIDKERTKRNFSIYIDIYDYIMEFIMEIKNELHLELKGRVEIPQLILEQTKLFTAEEARLDAFVETIVKKLKEQIVN